MTNFLIFLIPRDLVKPDKHQVIKLQITSTKLQTNPKSEIQNSKHILSIFRLRRAPKAHPPLADIRLWRRFASWRKISKLFGISVIFRLRRIRLWRRILRFGFILSVYARSRQVRLSSSSGYTLSPNCPLFLF